MSSENIEGLADAAGRSLLDVHSDPHHHRSVFTLAGPGVEQDARHLARWAVDNLDIKSHTGVHPRLGTVDVVPFVPLPGHGATSEDAEAARDRFAYWIASELGVPVFLYGKQRTLPDVRRQAFVGLRPDFGPGTPHLIAGACAVGARDLLVAYNLWLDGTSTVEARRVAAGLRNAHVRSLGLDVGGRAQVSCNLVDPLVVGPADVYDRVAAMAHVTGAELVGLVPRAVLDATSPDRWDQLDLSPDKTIEARMRARLDEGKV